MADRSSRALMLGLLATTALASPALAQTPAPSDATPTTPTTQSPAPETNATDVTSPPEPVKQAQANAGVPDETEIIITATKREENLQNVPISVQAIGTRRLDQLNITNFEDYTKQLPSVSYQTSAPGYTTVYMRGVATGGDGNHTGSLPLVGTYLDEQPVTTIGGTLDVHIYDIARIESLAGPQGTLYGASSEAGTIRIITNKPELGVTTGRVDAEINKVDHGGWGGNLEGMINLPIGPHIAFRASGFYQRDAGYIDNIHREFTFCGDTIFDEDENPIGCVRNGFHEDNAAVVKKNFNVNDTYGGRAALKIDLDDNWTITPTIMHQHSKTEGVWFADDALGDLQTARFRKEPGLDKWTQYALTVEGKVGIFDITYAGAYMDRPNHVVGDYMEYTEAYDVYYEPYGGIAYWLYFTDADGNQVNPNMYINGSNHFKKTSHEFRVATPSDKPFRVIAGAFYQHQFNHIVQEYRLDNLDPNLSVNGRPGFMWLTDEHRVDRDQAIFGEASYDVTPQITFTAGGRYYKFNNTVFGFAGYGRNPLYDVPGSDVPPNGFGSTGTGIPQCFVTGGLTYGEALEAGTDRTFIGDPLEGTPCVNVGRVENGQVKGKQSKGNGWIYRLNGTWRPRDGMMFYGTWSKGFRPGGINRQPGLAPYQPDYLTNYELGWKTSWGPLRWNGALYHQLWDKMQFSFLGENSLTVVQNGRQARINGLETDINYQRGGLSLTAAAAYTDAKAKGNICDVAIDETPDCTTFYPDLGSHGKQDEIVVPDGTRLPVTPKLKVTGTARYTWDMGPGKAHAQLGVVTQGSARSQIKPADEEIVGKLPGYTLVDLFLGYDWERYGIELFTTNVFDARNQLSRNVFCLPCSVPLNVNDEPTGLNQVHYIPGRPRTFGLRVGAKF